MNYRVFQTWLSALTVVLLFCLVVHQGWVGVSMENDGLIYASIAKHQALNQGSFWFPYSMLGEESFHHHPPLAFWLQSVYFRVFGDAFWVENLYQVTCLLLILVVLAIVAKQIQQIERVWLILLCYLTMPVIAFVFTDNFLEVTLTLFAVSAIGTQLAATRSENWSGFVWMPLAAVLTVGAFLTKGPVGLFPLIAPMVFAWMFETPFKKFASLYGAYLVSLFVLAAGLVTSVEARTSLQAYIEFQWLGTAMGERPQVHGRDYFIGQLLSNLLVPGIIVAIMGWRLGITANRNATGWLIIALSASIPMLISPRHFKWYIAPSLPFYALFFASLVKPPEKLVSPRQVAMTAVLCTALFFGFLYESIKNFGSADNDHGAIHDLTALKAALPRGARIGICRQDVPDAHQSQATINVRYILYLSRHHSIEVLPFDGQEFLFCDDLEAVPADYRQLNLGLQVHNLYQHSP